MSYNPSPRAGCASDESGKSDMDLVAEFFKNKITLKSEIIEDEEKVIPELTVDGLIKHWNEKGFKKIITMVGAGISTSAGIPDFRSPGSGIYHNLEKFELPDPMLVFDFNYFRYDPKPFFTLAKDLYPVKVYPTPAHYFCRLLHEKGLLQRHYTQNIDTLDRIAGIPTDKLVEAHGTFFTNHCMDCKKFFSKEWMKKQIFDDIIPKCDACNGVVRPDIIFFNENLPKEFFSYPYDDFKECDLLIIMGTSLTVNPFATLIDNARPKCIRFLMNKTKVGHKIDNIGSWIISSPGLRYDDEKNNLRDIAYIGDCDEGVMLLANGLGWGEDLRQLIKKEHNLLRKEYKSDNEEETEEETEETENKNEISDFKSEGETEDENESKKKGEKEDEEVNKKECEEEDTES